MEAAVRTLHAAASRGKITLAVRMEYCVCAADNVSSHLDQRAGLQTIHQLTTKHEIAQIITQSGSAQSFSGLACPVE